MRNELKLNVCTLVHYLDALNVTIPYSVINIFITFFNKSSKFWVLIILFSSETGWKLWKETECIYTHLNMQFISSEQIFWILFEKSDLRKTKLYLICNKNIKVNSIQLVWLVWVKIRFPSLMQESALYTRLQRVKTMVPILQKDVTIFFFFFK